MLKQALKRAWFCQAVQREPLTLEAKLLMLNPETIQLTIPIRRAQSIDVTVPMTTTLDELAAKLQQKLTITNIQFLCNEHQQLYQKTPLHLMLNRYFFIKSEEYFSFPVSGQLIGQKKNEEIIDGLRSMELPAVTQREVSEYLKRIQKWIHLKYGKSMMDEDFRVTKEEIGQIFVDSLIDPTPQQRDVSVIEQHWRKTYWELEELRDKKREADKKCVQKARRRMSLGLGALTANIGFIWSGTYIYFSWDIVEPLAYFSSSLAVIALTYQFFKMGKPYTNANYLEYLTKKYSQRIYKEIGFSEMELKQKQYELAQLEALLKDYFAKRL